MSQFFIPKRITQFRLFHFGYTLVIALLILPVILPASAHCAQVAITSSAGANGSISPSGAVTVNSGADQSFAITANTNYHIADVVVDSVHLGPQASPYTYTFTNVQGAHTISTTFGRVVNVATVAQLASAISNQQTGDEIILATGTYQLNSTYGATYGFVLNVNNLYIHSATGNRDDVSILGDNDASSAVVGFIFNFSQGAAQYATIKDMTLGLVAHSAIQWNGNESGSYSTVTNVHIRDCYEQFIKGAFVSTGTTGVTIQNSLFDYTSSNHLAPYYYTCAIDIHAPMNCVIQDNVIKYMQSPATTQAEPAIHLWANTASYSGNIIQRNRIIDCDRGIAYWEPSTNTTSNPGIIRNNMIYNSGTGLYDDVAIYVEYSPGAQIYNNTIYSLASYANAIEYRFTATKGVLIQNNLANKAITARDGATGTVSYNVTNAIGAWFVSSSTGDLHLAYAVSSVVGQGVAVSGLKDDFDKQARGSSIDIGADQYAAATAYAITVTQGNNGAIAPGTTSVTSGGSQTFTITPDTGYRIATVTVDGTALTSAVTSYTFSNVTANHSISATFTADTFTITSSAGANGSISPSPSATVTSGGSQTFTITPNTGYKIATVTVDGTALSSPVTTFTFSNVTANHSIYATFAAIPVTYTVTATAGANGSISPSATVTSGGSQTFTITPNTGYRVATVTVDGTALSSPVTTYTFNNVTANHSIYATFAAIPVTYTVTAIAGANGSISPSPSATVTSGGSQTFTITPNTGYRVATVTVDGTALTSAVTSYTFNNVTANHSIAATFSPLNQPPVADAGPTQTVPEGTLVTLNGSNSTDPGNSPLTYMWTQTAGPQVTLSSPTVAKPTFTAPNVGTAGASLAFQLTVTNQIGLKSSASCIVNVTWSNAPPTANAGSNQTVPEGTEVTLDGSGSTDPDDGIASYAWKQIAGPAVTLKTTTPSQAVFIAPNVGQTGTSLTFQLTVTDKGGLRSTATCVVNVTWINSPPQANAGQDQTVYEGNLVVLDGSASSDTDDGIKTYLWTQTSGSPVTLTNPTSVQPYFTAPSVSASGATLTFRLTVTDNGGLQSTDTCNVNVQQNTGVDLTGSWKSLYYNGFKLSASFTIKNVGNQNAGSFVTKFYFSSDGSTLGKLITQSNLNSLNAAQSKSVSFSYYATGLAGKYVIAVIDANNNVVESNKQNNKISAVIP